MKKTAVFVLVLSLLFVVVYSVYFFRSLPVITGIKEGISVRVYKGGEYLGRRQVNPSHDSFIRSDALPKHAAGAIIVSEDGRFWSHKGIDPHEIAQAAVRDLKSGAKKHGASTMTQQLVKNLYFSGEKTFGRKIREAVTAMRVERVLSKREILDYYMNTAQFGDGVYGIAEASNHYFGKNPAALTAEESALLAFFLPRPVLRGGMYSSGKVNAYQAECAAAILSRMKKQGYVEEELRGR